MASLTDRTEVDENRSNLVGENPKPMIKKKQILVKPKQPTDGSNWADKSSGLFRQNRKSQSPTIDI